MEKSKKFNKNATIIKISMRNHNNLNLKEDIIKEILKFCDEKELLPKENNQKKITKIIS